MPVETPVAGYSYVFVEYFNNIPCKPYVNFVFYILVRYAIIHFVYGDVVIKLNNRNLPT
jgi:hypothetical protein